MTLVNTIKTIWMKTGRTFFTEKKKEKKGGGRTLLPASVRPETETAFEFDIGDCRTTDGPATGLFYKTAPLKFGMPVPIVPAFEGLIPETPTIDRILLTHLYVSINGKVFKVGVCDLKPLGSRTVIDCNFMIDEETQVISMDGSELPNAVSFLCDVRLAVIYEKDKQAVTLVPIRIRSAKLEGTGKPSSKMRIDSYSTWKVAVEAYQLEA